MRRPARVAAVSELVAVSEEVREALEQSRPVVALETTLVAHGFPAPDGVEVGLESEAAVRDAGAVPATIEVLDGRIGVGLLPADLKRFTPRPASSGRVRSRPARSRERSARPRSAGRSPSRAPSGSASWGPAASVGCTAAIRPAGRLRGPRGARLRTGARRLLGRQVTPRRPRHDGVPGDTRDPGRRLPHRHAAALLRRRGRAGARGSRRERGRRGAGRRRSLGARRLRPPAREPSPESVDVSRLIEDALADARLEGVTGQAVTPYVLGLLHERSGGRTREVNRKLIVANARLAAEVAVAFATP